MAAPGAVAVKSGAGQGGRMSGHPFDAAVALVAGEGDTWQGRHQRCLRQHDRSVRRHHRRAGCWPRCCMHPQRLGEPVALTVNFAAAVADGPFTIVAHAGPHQPLDPALDRAAAAAGPGGATGTVFTAVRRDTWSAASTRCPLCRRPWTTCRRPARQRRRVDAPLRDAFRRGRRTPTPGHGRDQGDSRTALWMRDAPPRPLDFASLTALADVLLPAHLAAPARRSCRSAP